MSDHDAGEPIGVRSKSEALADYLRLLGGGGDLPSGLVDEATTTDLDAAAKELLKIQAALPLDRTFGGGTDWALRRSWEAMPSARRTEEFGIPWLRQAIAQRRETAADAA
jgi:hypothetical protein